MTTVLGFPKLKVLYILHSTISHVFIAGRIALWFDLRAENSMQDLLYAQQCVMNGPNIK